MNRIVKKIHVYLGLLNFSFLLVFGITGLTATFDPGPERRVAREPSVRFEALRVSPGLGDAELAEAVYRAIRVPLAGPPPKFALRRDRDGNLAFNLYDVNGLSKVTVLERESRIRVETTRSSFWRFFDALHTTTINSSSPDPRVTLWKYYNEFAIWSLLAMAVSGTWLGLTSRPGYRPARWALVLGCAVFITLYAVTR